MDGMDRISGSPKSESLLALWRHRNPAAALAVATCESHFGALCASVSGLRPLVCEVIDMLDADGVFALAESGAHWGAGGPRDSLATDMLASALLVEAMLGCESARVALARLRRQRRLRGIVWTRGGQTNGAEDATADRAAAAFAAP